MSQFDDLLADLGGDSTTSTTKATSNGGSDPFDPLGGSATNGGDNGFLLDFAVTTDVKNGDGGAPSGNPLYDLSADAPSGNPLYDLDFSSGSGNPLYDLSTEVTTEDSNTNQSADPFADFINEDSNTTQSADLNTNQSADPFADFINDTPAGFNNAGQPVTMDTTMPDQPLEEPQSANPLYDFTAEDTNASAKPTPPAAANANPLYDLDNAFGVEVEASPANPAMDSPSADASASQEADFFLSASVTTDMTTTTDQEEVAVGAGSGSADILGDFGGSSGLEETSQEVTDVAEVAEEVAEARGALLADDFMGGAYDGSAQVEDPAQEADQQGGVTLNGFSDGQESHTEDQFADSGLDSQQFSSQAFVSEQRLEQNGVSEEVSSLVPEQEPIAEPEPEPTPAPAQNTMEGIQQEVLSSEGGVYESEPKVVHEQWQNGEEEEEGVHESQPITRDDVVREADRDVTADLPAVGATSNLKAKWNSGQVETTSAPRAKREITPPAHGTGGEYVSEPRSYTEQYEGQAEAGVFESEPVRDEAVVTSEAKVEEVFAQQGSAKNIAARFKEIEKTNASFVKSESKREITPDRSAQAEFVSEPRKAAIINEEAKAESGVFESQPAINPDVVRSGEGAEEVLPEVGSAKGMAARFKQMSTDSETYTPRAKREITPDTTGQPGEYVSEPRTVHEQYEAPKVDSGVFESTPTSDPNVVKSDQLVSRDEADDFKPERGSAKNMAARFRELENTAKSPPLSPGRRKEFTPPREDQSVGTFESTPEMKADVVRAEDSVEETVPEKGSTRNIANRFKQLETENKSPGSRGPKEFTPPPGGNAGVYESNPTTTTYDYNRPAESGIIENEPILRDDVVRGDDAPKYEVELPERGFAKNRLSQWRQMEQSSNVTSPNSKGKEFTPPRDEPRIAQYRKSPRTPLSPGGNLDNGSVHPSDLPGQYQPQSSTEPSVFESEPERLPDVTREDDTDWAAGMPKKDTAKKMLAKFQKIQSEVKVEEDKPSPKKDSESDNRESESESRQSEKENRQSESREQEPPMDAARLKFEDPEKLGRSKSMRAAVQTEKCGACEKTVYAMERLEMNKRVYHKACFRCSQCRSVLTPKTFAINNDVIFCTAHYKQMFTTKGNYDEGFGRPQHKKRWGSNPNLATANGEENEAKS